MVGGIRYTDIVYVWRYLDVLHDVLNFWPRSEIYFLSICLSVCKTIYLNSEDNLYFLKAMPWSFSTPAPRNVSHRVSKLWGRDSRNTRHSQEKSVQKKSGSWANSPEMMIPCQQQKMSQPLEITMSLDRLSEWNVDWSNSRDRQEIDYIRTRLIFIWRTVVRKLRRVNYYL